MKHLKNFKQFEDVGNSTTAGMGSVTSSQTSTTSVSSSISGSGDLASTFKSKKKIGKKTTKDAGDLRYLGKEKLLGKFTIKK
jgi:hypothetical protein